ncbi:unnamed protein product [Urochloa humidicola]
MPARRFWPSPPHARQHDPAAAAGHPAPCSHRVALAVLRGRAPALGHSAGRIRQPRDAPKSGCPPARRVAQPPRRHLRRPDPPPPAPPLPRLRRRPCAASRRRLYRAARATATWSAPESRHRCPRLNRRCPDLAAPHRGGFPTPSRPLTRTAAAAFDPHHVLLRRQRGMLIQQSPPLLPHPPSWLLWLHQRLCLGDSVPVTSTAVRRPATA